MLVTLRLFTIPRPIFSKRQRGVYGTPAVFVDEAVCAEDQYINNARAMIENSDYNVDDVEVRVYSADATNTLKTVLTHSRIIQQQVA